jgi:hypothetical protein
VDRLDRLDPDRVDVVDRNPARVDPGRGPGNRVSDGIDTPGHCGYHDEPPVGKPTAGIRHLRPVVVSVASLLENGIVRAKSQCGQLRGALRRVKQLNLSN